jgi:hypothetical protein
MRHQTAVEFLVKELSEVLGTLNLDSAQESSLIEAIKKSNKMFEDQIVKAACHDPFLGNLPKSEGDHYFKKTYGQE